jgi:hypothetical protein
MTRIRLELEEKVHEALKRSRFRREKNGIVYRWLKSIRFSWYVWNLYHPNDLMVKGCGKLMHHKNNRTLDDSINNLDKVTRGEHNTIHSEKGRHMGVH